MIHETYNNVKGESFTFNATAAHKIAVTDKLYRAAYRTDHLVERNELLAQMAAIKQLNTETFAKTFMTKYLRGLYETYIIEEKSAVLGTDVEIKLVTSTKGKNVEHFSFLTVSSFINRLREVAKIADVAAQAVIKRIEHDALRIDDAPTSATYRFVAQGRLHEVSFTQI